MSLYNHFASKDDLILSVLQQEEERFQSSGVLRNLQVQTCEFAIPRRSHPRMPILKGMLGFFPGASFLRTRRMTAETSGCE